MKQTSLVFLFFTALTFNACRKECKTYTYVPTSPAALNYFGNYKPGSYWIYLNRDSTKRDSIWVGNFKVDRTGDGQFSCTEGSVISFDLHSEYLDSFKIIPTKIDRNGQDMYTTLVSIYLTSSFGYYGLDARFDSEVFYLGPNKPPFVNNYSIWRNSSTTYDSVVGEGRNILLAPRIGIIQYRPLFSEDTFSLLKFHKL